MPDSIPQEAPLGQMRPIVSEPVPFTEYGDKPQANRRFVATSGWRMWLQIVLALIVILALGFVGLVMWRGEVAIAGMTFTNPWAKYVDTKVASDLPAASPTPMSDPVVTENLLQPLKLSTILPRLAIRQGDKDYLVNYEGGDRMELSTDRYSGMMGGSNRCMYYVKDNQKLYRSAIDGSQEQLVIELDAALFEIPDGFSGDTGPGYGIQLLGVDENCQQAIVGVHINTATETMPTDGNYLVIPEQKSGLVHLESDKEFMEFRGGKPWFASHGRVYTVNGNGVFSSPYTYSAPIGYSPDSFTNVSPDGVLVDAIYLDPSGSNNIDPISGQEVSDGVSKIVEMNLRTGVATAIAADSSTFYQQVFISPDFTHISYLKDTGETRQNYRMSELYLYDRQSQKTHMLNLAKGALGRTLWLDDTTFVLAHTAIAPSPSQPVDTVMTCSVATLSCKKLVDGDLVTDLHFN